MPTLAFGKEDARLWFEIRVDDVSVATSGTHLAASDLKVMARFRFNHDQFRQLRVDARSRRPSLGVKPTKNQLCIGRSTRQRQEWSALLARRATRSVLCTSLNALKDNFDERGPWSRVNEDWKYRCQTEARSSDSYTVWASRQTGVVPAARLHVSIHMPCISI